MTDNQVKIAAIAGSIRTKSYNRMLINLAAERLPQDSSLKIVEIADLPLFNEDLEPGGFPFEVKIFRDELYQADAILIATPEYNSSIPGVLKNALDWASRSENRMPNPLSGKPVAIVGAGGRTATARAQSHLRQITNHLNMYTINKPEVIISMVPHQPFHESGTLQDEVSLRLLAELLANLVKFTRMLRMQNVEEIQPA